MYPIILIIAGLGMMAAALIGGVAAIMVFRVTGKRLDKELSREFGKKNRQ